MLSTGLRKNKVEQTLQHTFPLVTIGLTLVIIIVVLHQALWAPKSPTNKEQRDNLCTSTPEGMIIPKGMLIVPINGGFLLCPNTLKTLLFKDYFFINMSLNNYDGLADLREYMQNIRSSLKLIIQDYDSICKIFHSTFRGFTCA
jgi:hypothetical protein